MGKRYIHYDSNGFIKGTTHVKEDGEGATLSEIICPLLTGVIALWGLAKIWQILEVWF